MILDSEVLLIDNKTGKPLPFGSLGVHKVLAQGKCARMSVHVCIYVCVLLVWKGEEYITCLGSGLFFVSGLFLSLYVFWIFCIKRS